MQECSAHTLSFKTKPENQSSFRETGVQCNDGFTSVQNNPRNDWKIEMKVWME
jgi:hypothetical protein